MLNTISQEVRKFEKVCLNRFSLLHLGVIIISFLPYYFASDGFYSIWKSLSSFNEVWKGLSGFHSFSFVNVITLALCPVVFLISVAIIYFKTFRHEGGVVMQMFTRSDALESDNWFLAAFYGIFFSTLMYVYVFLFQFISGVVLLLSNEKTENEFLPSFGYYLFFLLLGCSIYFIWKDLKNKFNFKLIFIQLSHELVDEFEIALHNYLVRAGLMDTIETLAKIFGDDVNTIEVETASLEVNNLPSNKVIAEKNTNRDVIQERVKYFQTKPSLELLFADSKRKFSGYFFHEIGLDSSYTLDLIARNKGKGPLELTVKSNLKGMFVEPSEISLNEGGSSKILRLVCTPRFDSTIKTGSFKKGLLYFGYPYMEKFKQTSFDIGFYTKGYNEKVRWNPIVSAIIAFVLTFAVSPLSQLFMEPLSLDLSENEFGALFIFLALFGSPIISYLIGKFYFPSFPTNQKALIIIPLLSILCVQTGLYTAVKSNVFSSEQQGITQAETLGKVNATRGLIVREGPSSTYKRIGILKDKTTVRIISLSENSNWYEVQEIGETGIKGFVSKRYIELGQ